MLEQNTHRLMMTILGVLVLALILLVVYQTDSDSPGWDRSFIDQSMETITHKNQNRTPKY